MGSQSKRRKGTKDNRSIISDIKRETDQDANRTALQPSFEGLAYSPVGITQTDFVDVTETIDPLQTNVPSAPAQVTGLNVTVGGNNNTLNLAWTNIATVTYNIYRGISSGGEILVSTSATNSYSDSNLLSGTPYFYKVSAVNFLGMEGTLSTENTATTTGTTPPMLELHFDDTYNDTSPYSQAIRTLQTMDNGFTPSGQFGSALLVNTPITPAVSQKEAIYAIDDPHLTMNTSVGFTFSGWIYPVDFTHAAGYRRFIVEKRDDSNNTWHLSTDSAGILYFQVTKAGTTYKRQIAGFVLNSWQHIGAVFNGVTNTVEVYRNGVAGVSSTAADSTGNHTDLAFIMGCRYDGLVTGTAASTYFEGRMDEFRYYQKVLTSTQINNLMNTNAP